MCWDKDILSYINAEMIEDTPVNIAKEEEKGKRNKPATEAGWFSDDQKRIIEPTTIHMNQLIGKMYTNSVKTADKTKDAFSKNPNGRYYTKHPNAEAYADAYYSVMKNPKHGTDIVLPRHLWDVIPIHLHKYLKEHA